MHTEIHTAIHFFACICIQIQDFVVTLFIIKSRKKKQNPVVGDDNYGSSMLFDIVLAWVPYRLASL